MLWRLSIPTAFPFFPEKFISVSGFGPSPWGESRQEGWGHCQHHTLPRPTVPIFPSPCITASPPTLTSPFGLPLFLFHYAFGKVVFLSCHMSGESFCVIKCYTFLDFGHLQIPHSLLLCRGCDSFFFLIWVHLYLTIADHGD